MYVDMTQNIHLYIVRYLSVINISWLRTGLHLSDTKLGRQKDIALPLVRCPSHSPNWQQIKVRDTRKNI